MMNVRNLIQQEIGRSDERDPGVIANRVAMRLSAKEARQALGETLRSYVRVEMGLARMKGQRSPALSRTSSARTRSAGHSKWDRYRNLLDTGIFVRDEWKRMADCTAEDFDWLAEDREQRAAELAAVAERYRGYAAAMRKARAATFGDLHERDAVVAA